MPLTAPTVTARPLLRQVARSYTRRRVLAGLVPVLAAAGLLAVLAARWPAGWPLLLALAGLSVALGSWQLWPLRQWGEAPAAARLDRLYPALQDSTHLLLADEEALPLLPRLQRQRVAAQLAELAAATPALLPVNFTKPLALAALLLAGAALAWWRPAPAAAPRPAAVPLQLHPDPQRPTGTPAGPASIEQLQLLVTPPAYTRQAAFVPAGASFTCPAGARVRWVVQVSGGAAAPPLLELGGQRLALRPVAGQARRYAVEQVLTASTLYRLRFARQVSDDYALRVQPDRVPTIRIQSPQPYTLLATKAQPALTFQATTRDDYGLSRAELVLTVATGQGEAVKFRELRRDLSASLASQPTQATLGSQLNLPQLGLHPGDELYLYLRAQDNHGQAARSDTYLVQWQDSAAAASALDLGLGVNTAPAYFRSERQIIIDTEKLLAERKHLSPAEFASRSNALGFDQQALRLRYGKFLGEEAEKSLGPTAAPAAAEPELPIAAEPALPIADAAPAAAPPAEHDEHDEHDHQHVGAPPHDSPTAATDALLDAYVHKHDDAETADFLEPAVKAKLQAVLSEMWAAELRLRTNKPAEARPYEYRALRLLKEVQQQTRAYVRKAGYVPPPLPEATLRLTGELRGAAAPHEQLTVTPPAAQPAVRAALRWLAAVRSGQRPRPADVRLLEPASAALAARATEQPLRFLPALRALRQLAQRVRSQQPASTQALLAAEQGLSALLPAPAPAAPPAAAPNRLSRRYLQELGE